MDFKPFLNQQQFNLWNSPVSTVIAAIAVLAFIGFVVSLMNDANSFWTTMLLMVVVFSFPAIGLTYSLTAYSADKDAYTDYVASFKNALHDEGFTIITGTPNLRANTTSDLMLQYDNKNFKCTLHTPIEAEISVVFSCDEDNLSLEEIKQ